MIVSIIGIISLTVIGVAAIYSLTTILLDGGFIAAWRHGFHRPVRPTAEHLTKNAEATAPETEESAEYAEAGRRD